MKIKLLQQFLRKQLKKSRRFSGFTLLELLVAMLIATIIVSTLLTFANGVLETNRREEAKSESQQEVQAALDYIADDVRESVFIYDANGLAAISAQLPTATNATPILVFWKRHFYNTEDTVVIYDGTSRKVKCLPYATTTPEANCLGGSQYVYSLVAYYLVKGDNTNVQWSNAARINRWELRAGIPGGNAGTNGADSVNCAEADRDDCPFGAQRNDGNQSAATNPDTSLYYVRPSVGFSPFSLSGGGNLTARMTAWQKAANTTYPSLDASNFVTLVDYIDDNLSNNTSIPPTIVVGNTPVADANNPALQSCANPDLGVGTGGAQRIPATFTTTSSNAAENLSSFYACVSSSQLTARIYIRGSALARLYDLAAQRTANANNTTFLPTSNVRVFGRGFLNVN